MWHRRGRRTGECGKKVKANKEEDEGLKGRGGTVKGGQEVGDGGKARGRELAHGSKRAMPTERVREHCWVYAGGGGAGESLEGCVYVFV